MTRINFSTESFDPDNIYDQVNETNGTYSSENTSASNLDSRERRRKRNERRKAENEKNEKKQSILTRFFSDRRVINFLGVAIILVATFIALASISHISNGIKDQSITINKKKNLKFLPDINLIFSNFVL